MVSTKLLIPLLLISSAVIMLFLIPKKKLSGIVYDCEDKKPIADALVTISATGWGFRNNLLVWDKSYLTSDVSESNGSYDLEYKRGTMLKTTKAGYLDSYGSSYPGSKDIGLMKDMENYGGGAFSYDCKLSTECIKSQMVNDVEVSWDSCTNPDYKP